MHASMNTHTVQPKGLICRHVWQHPDRHALWHPHISWRSAGSRIAAFLHQGLNINVWGQISSRGNPFKAILLSGWWSWLIYANLYAQFMQIWCFNLNQCVEWFEGFCQSYCVCTSRLVLVSTYQTTLFTESLCLKSPIYCPVLSFTAVASPVQKGAAVDSAQTSLTAIYFLLTPPFICVIPDALQRLWTVTEPDVDLDLNTDTDKYTSHLKDMGEGTGGFSSALLSNGRWWRHSLWLWVMFIHSKVIGRVKMRHAQCELNQARLETAPLTSSLHLAFLYQRSLTSDPCPPPPSPSSSTKSFNPGFSVTPPFCSGVGVHVCSPALWKSAGQHCQQPLEKERGGGKEIAFSIAVMAASIINIKITTLAWAISRLQFVGFWKKRCHCHHKSEGLLCSYSTEKVKSGQINSTWQKTISVDY